MKKCKVHSVDDKLFEKCSKRVVIHRDMFPPNPLKDYDQTFYLHSRIDDITGNEDDNNYPDPLVEIEDEYGYGTGEYKCRDGVVAFWVSAYIHSGIALSLGTVRCAFGDTPIPGGGGRGFDTTPNAAFMWTDKERFEKMNGPWMEVYDEETKTRRPAKDEAEFRKYLWEIAKDELELFQKYMDGECFGWSEKIRVPFKRVYPDGREIDDCEWEDGDSCGGYYVDSIDDFEFAKDEDTDVFDETGHFVGDEWTIPEFVVRSPVSGLYLMTEGSKDSDAEWTGDWAKAKVFNNRNNAYNAVIQHGKRLYEYAEYAKNGGHDAIRDRDELK